MRKCFLLLFFVFGTFALIPVTSAFYDTFQNHPNDNVSLPEDSIYATAWEWYVYTARGGNPDTFDVITTDINNKKVLLKGSAYIKLTSPTSCSNHWSALIRGSVSGGTDGVHFSVFFYNSSGGLINESDNLLQYLTSYPGYNVWEFVRTGSNIYLYINGEYVTDIGNTYPEKPCYIRYDTSAYYSNKYATVYVDDVTILDGVIETFPHNWYILRHWDAPETSGLYDESDTRVEEHNFTVSYTVPYVGIDTCDEIRIKHFTSGEVVNTTPISDRYGTIYYNFTEMLFHQNKEEDKYGYYFVELMRGGDVVARDYFYFTWDALDKPSGIISWDKDSYASGSVAKIHINLTDPDFSTYVYKGYVYDIYGNKKEEWIVSSADEYHEVDLNGYDAGVYYACLLYTSPSPRDRG